MATRLSGTLSKCLALSGIPHMAVASYPWDFLAIAYFQPAYSYDLSKEHSSVFRISIPDFEPEMSRLAEQAIESWVLHSDRMLSRSGPAFVKKNDIDRCFVGINKSHDRASVCMIEESLGEAKIQILLKERFSRVKIDGGMLTDCFARIRPRLDPKRDYYAENSCHGSPLSDERSMNKDVPYFEALKRLDLGAFSSRFNPKMKFVTHHYCHAMSATAISPP